MKGRAGRKLKERKGKINDDTKIAIKQSYTFFQFLKFDENIHIITFM